MEVVNDVLHCALDDESLELKGHLGEVHDIYTIDDFKGLTELELLNLWDDDLEVFL